MKYNTKLLLKSLIATLKNLDNLKRTNKDYTSILKREKKAALWTLDKIKEQIEKY